MCLTLKAFTGNKAHHITISSALSTGSEDQVEILDKEHETDYYRWIDVQGTEFSSMEEDLPFYFVEINPTVSDWIIIHFQEQYNENCQS